MKTISEMIAVMQHFAAGGKVEMEYVDGSWELEDAPRWEWWSIDYRIAEEADPYAELKAANQLGSGKQIRCSDAVGFGGAVGIDWQDAGYEWKWSCAPQYYEIRDKPKPMKKVKLLAWFDGNALFWRTEKFMCEANKRVPSEDKEIEVEDE